MTQQQTRPAATEPRQTLGFFAIVGPGRRPVGEQIAGCMNCGPQLHEDADFSTVFTADAPVRLRAPQEAITDDWEDAGRIGFFSQRGALMWTTKARITTVGGRLSLPGVRVVEGTQAPGPDDTPDHDRAAG